MKEKILEPLIMASPFMAILALFLSWAYLGVTYGIPSPFTLWNDAGICNTSKHIVMVAPDFTFSAYGGEDRKHSFYEYYQGSKDESMLWVPYEEDKHARKFLDTNAANILEMCRANTTIISDMDMHYNKLPLQVNTIILGHQEYVTEQEYQNLKDFVGNGGKLILLDGNTFYAEVQLIRDNDTCSNCNPYLIKLIRGHNFNGVSEAFENSWAGFHYCGNADKSSLTYEADCPTYTTQTTVLKAWTETIVSYRVQYGEGQVYHMGIYSEQHFDDPELINLLHVILNTK